MTDYNTQERQEWLSDMQYDPDNSPWWWAIGAAFLGLLVMLSASIPA